MELNKTIMYKGKPLMTLYIEPDEHNFFIWERQNLLLLPKTVQMRSLEIVREELKNRHIICEGLMM